MIVIDKTVDKVRKRINTLLSDRQKTISEVNDRITTVTTAKEKAKADMKKFLISGEYDKYNNARADLDEAKFQEEALTMYRTELETQTLVDDSEALKVEEELDKLSCEVRDQANTEIKQMLANLINACKKADDDINSIRGLMIKWQEDIARDVEKINRKGFEYYMGDIKGVNPRDTAYRNILDSIENYNDMFSW